MLTYTLASFTLSLTRVKIPRASRAFRSRACCSVNGAAPVPAAADPFAPAAPSAVAAATAAVASSGPFPSVPSASPIASPCAANAHCGETCNALSKNSAERVNFADRSRCASLAGFLFSRAST